MVGVDGSTMKANAALRTIVRRHSGETYREMLTRMAKESGVETPTIDDFIRLDRKRKGKKLSNEDWTSKTDPDAKIAKMKDGDASRLQARTCGRSRHGRDRGGPDPRGRPGRHDDTRTHAQGNGKEPVRRGPCAALVYGYRRGGILRVVGQMFTVALTGVCRAVQV